MDPENISEEIRTLHWRDYCRLINFAIENQIVIDEENLVWPVLQIPENYKVSALIRYSNEVVPISKNALSKILDKIEGHVSESYEKHIRNLLTQIKVHN